MKILRHAKWAVWMILALSACAGQLTAAEPADVIFVGANVVTMDPAAETVDAVAIGGGVILAAGSKAQVMALKNEDTRVEELGERALLPGFIDAHGHLLAQASLLEFANLSAPPVGTVSDIAGLGEALASYIKTREIPAGHWVIGFGYDDSLLAERRHPTRQDLDAVSHEHPIFLMHVSGHLGAANSMALEKAGIDAESKDPPGGVIRRQNDGKTPDGVLEETAAFAVYYALPQPDEAESLRQVSTAQAYYARNGITTAQEGAATPSNIAILKAAAERGELFLDVVAYQAWTPDQGDMPVVDQPLVYRQRYRTGGIKLILDGSPQGKTAFLSQPYHVPPAGQSADYVGYPTYADEVVNEAVLDLLTRRTPFLAHANGDAAAEQLIRAVEIASQAVRVDDQRSVLIHAQTVRDDQLDRMLPLGMVPSFFTAHTFFWGDWHRDSVLGPQRGDRISPTASALERGMHFTVHNDAPVTPPKPIDLLWSTVNRRTRSNDILGPGQRLTTKDALKALTLDAAYQYFEEQRKGSITVGKQADLVILSANPLNTEPEDLRSLQVVETWSRGERVFSSTE